MKNLRVTIPVTLLLSVTAWSCVYAKPPASDYKTIEYLEKLREKIKNTQ